MLGLYVSDHPLLGAERALRQRVECSIAEFLERDDGALATVGGVVTSLQRKFTKKGDPMAVFVLEDLQSTVEVMVFPKTMLDPRPQAGRRRRGVREGSASTHGTRRPS
jgi:DNA polymerase-3 subunit alpha